MYKILDYAKKHDFSKLYKNHCIWLAAAREPGEGLSIQLGQTAANVPKKSKLSMLPQTVH